MAKQPKDKEDKEEENRQPQDDKQKDKKKFRIFSGFTNFFGRIFRKNANNNQEEPPHPGIN